MDRPLVGPVMDADRMREIERIIRAADSDIRTDDQPE